ncbi:MAG TPA: potassium-transporting ATPase subunit C [Acidimicrobiales bacterium]|jgi:K+-transporting ATPase ATPase C chain|nr:potassium-transporting ATPase subunit C [Acidimicrobiales bacterium]
MRRQLLTGLLVTISLILLTSVAYPLAVWGVGQVAFSHQSDGSLVRVNGKVVGSSLIGQNFTDKAGNPLPQYFQPRPSAAGVNGYDPTASSASNLGPSNPDLIGNDIGHPQDNPFRTPADPYCVPVPAPTKTNSGPVYKKNPDGTYVCNPTTVPERVLAYRRLNGLAPDVAVPVDAVTASGSGLDPDISVANALDQAPRVARARHLDVATVVALVHQHTRGRAWGILGENTVNVLDLNVALDRPTGAG